MSHRAFTVALVGPDGAGKTTICRKLLAQLPWPSTYVYMGINQDACNVLLPTTWAWLRLKKLVGMHTSMGGPPPLRTTAPTKRFQPLRTGKSLLRTANLLAEEWFRCLVSWFAVRSGKIVIMDRHFLLDYYAHDIVPDANQRTLARRIHGYFLKRFPIPDLILLLDMSPESLFQRKPEGTVEALARRRQEYLALEDKFPHFVTIDAAQPLDVVVCKALDAITAFHARLKSREGEALWEGEFTWEGEAPAEPPRQRPLHAGDLDATQLRWDFYADPQLKPNGQIGNAKFPQLSPPPI